MNRARAFQAAANAATLANALLGVGAVAYTLAGNKLFAMLLVGCAVGFDGLDGLLHRRGGGPPTLLGRVLDSSADAISFGVAPGLFVGVHSFASAAYAPYGPATALAGAAVVVLALSRLVYFTLRSHKLPHFLGASTPQTTIALVLVLLFVDQPGYLGASPLGLLGAVALLAPLMVLPVPYPKLRRGAPLQPLMTLTSVALAFALVPVQFVPGRGSALYDAGVASAAVALISLALFYLLGPWRLGTEEGTLPAREAP